jgi:hypothetical protein
VQEKRNIVWLASYPKSGNTWIRLVLDYIFERDKKIIDINNVSKLNLIASSRKLFDEILSIDTSELADEEIDRYKPMVYRHLSLEAERLTYIKIHDCWKLNPNGYAIFPPEITAGVVYIIRNPLDLLISFANHCNVSLESSARMICDEKLYLYGDNQKIKSQIKQHISSWSNHFISWNDESKLPLLLVRYEDLLLDSFNVFCKILEFLNIEIDSVRLNNAIKQSSFTKLKEQESSFGFREKPLGSNSFFKFGSVNHWKTILDNETVDLVVKNHYDVLKRLDYFDLLGIEP